MAFGHPAVAAERFDLHAGLGRGRDEGTRPERPGSPNDVGALLGRRLLQEAFEVDAEIGVDDGGRHERSGLGHGRHRIAVL